jgi:ribosomal protein S24E
MKINIKEEKKEDLLSRRRVIAEIDFQGATPSGEDVKNLVSQTIKASPELVVIRKIQNAFGKTKAIVTALVYTNAEDMKKIETVKEKKTEE